MSDIHFNKEDGSKLKLFTPGPVQVPDRVLKELAKPNDTHRSKPYEQMHQKAVEGLQKILYTKNDCFIFTSSATGIMEACVRNLIKKDEKALFLSIGAFGDRWYEIGKTNGKDSVLETVEWGNAITSGVLAKALEKDKYSVVCLQANETSTGVYNPIEEILPLIKDHGALACVDATSSMAGVKIDIDKLNIDVCLASVQKCFALPPGLAVASVSDAALEKSKQVKNRGYYFDFQQFLKKNKAHQTPTTPPIPQIRGMVAQLDYIFNQEGLENRFKRHEQLGKRTRMWARDANLEMFPEKGFESNTVSTMRNSIEIDIAEMVYIMLLKGYRITNGYGNLANKTFRIGHMGEITLKELEEMLKVLTDVISELRLRKISS
ncbi:MAG: aminotransferase class V-fold PLP-dependent enzyme [Candidatus Lokiarchaeota archaeon]|nr:aminotransferase class V-fold PLP-dependent enzyme [Candidatus Lokiarchaeota archaeon]MBD3341530.1 aminotransferase class V-fold PLP-dependent enzyme [Candidatus Lokiarchaeota archaeon]